MSRCKLSNIAQILIFDSMMMSHVCKDDIHKTAMTGNYKDGIYKRKTLDSNGLVIK